MRRNDRTTRRNFLRGVGVAAGSLLLGGCDDLSGAPWFRRALSQAERLTLGVQRALLGADSLAREYTEADLSSAFRANGSTNPDDPAYQAAAAENFEGWRLKVDGLVEAPGEYSLAELRTMPARTQITRHDCVEGWSCIAKWTGTTLGGVLDQAKLKPTARFIVFHCYDTMGGGLAGAVPYYESCDLIDAYHPQTILAYGLNNEVLPVRNGAPVRVRIERALGYKQPKYVHTIEAVESFASFGQGMGGYWEDNGYDWYGGI